MQKCSECGAIFPDGAAGYVPYHFVDATKSVCSGAVEPGVEVKVYFVEHPDGPGNRVLFLLAASFEDVAKQCDRRIVRRGSGAAAVLAGGTIVWEAVEFSRSERALPSP